MTDRGRERSDAHVGGPHDNFVRVAEGPSVHDQRPLGCHTQHGVRVSSCRPPGCTAGALCWSTQVTCYTSGTTPKFEDPE